MTTHTAYKELHRSRSDRMIGGVCGGLGQYFNVNPVFYRVGFVILTLLGGAGLLVYGAAALVIPNEGEQESIASDILKNHRQRPVALVGLGLVALAGIALLSHVSWHFHSGTFWVILLIIGASMLWAQRRPRTPELPPGPVDSPHAGAAESGTTGAGATQAATTVIVTAPAASRNRWRWLRITAATTAGLIVVVIAGIAAFAAPHLHLGDGVGNRSYQPATISSLRYEYRLGVGDLRIDLSQLDLAAKSTPTTIRARMGIGHVEITVPRNVTVLTRSRVVWGDSRLLGHEESGHNVSDDIGNSHAKLILDAHVGIGDVVVRRAA
jgi:phage shock protein PspC (stress-responsive transcriptional regulator)